MLISYQYIRVYLCVETNKRLGIYLFIQFVVFLTAVAHVLAMSVQCSHNHLSFLGQLLNPGGSAVAAAAAAA